MIVQKKVSDLGISSYLMMYGFKPSGRQGKNVIFSIEDTDINEFEKLQMDYLTSDFHRFDSFLMSLKKMGENMHN